jgi:hypothetical protein
MLMRRLKTWACAIRHNVAGVAAIEFAIILPVLMLLLFGGFEGWRLVLAGQRMDNVAYSLSDLSSRLLAGTTEGDVTNMLSGGLFIAEPFDVQSQGRVILSAIDPGDGRKILWQRCIGAGSLSSGLGIEGGNADISRIDRMPTSTNDILYVTEVSLLYTPPLVGYIYGPLTIHRAAVVPGRVSNPTAIDPGGPSSPC